MADLQISICVVLYESIVTTKRFHLALCDSLSGSTAFEVLYFDNSSTDELEAWFAGRTNDRIRYNRDRRNLGFSYGNNWLILRAKYERILLLNPDVFGISGAFWNQLAKLNTAGTARFARLLNEDGSFQDCVGEPTSLGRALRRRPDYSALTQPTIVGMGIFAFMLTDKSVFAKVGLLDCSYPLYAEDMDWCFRATQSGIRVLFDPTLVLTHLGGASAQERWKRTEVRRRKYNAEQIFINHHFRGFRWACMRALSLLKILIRAI